MTTSASNNLTADELARYSRHIILPEIGVEGQTKLVNAKTLIVGAGGLGSPIALYLAAAGIGTIGIAEFDGIELHNLQRQILHHTNDVGASKAQSAEKRIKEINPHVKVHRHDSGITPENAIELFEQYDIIVDGTDNFGTRYLNNDAAYLAKRPLVYGSIFKFEGQVSVFDTPSGGPCYRCLFPEPPPPGSVPSCSEAGVFGALCGVIGSFQALETIKTLLTLGDGLSGKLVAIDTLSMQFRKLNIKRDANCPLCGTSPIITKIEAERYAYECEIEDETIMDTPTDYPLEIDTQTAHQALKEGKATLIDVREPFEFDICSIEGSTKIPMNSISIQISKT